MAFGVKTNERPGTRAVVRYARFSAFKARPILDLIRGKHVAEADEILQFTPRAAAVVIRKCLASAVANAQHNDELDADELYVAACFADEGPTLRRWRPRARGRATRIRKRTCHVTVIVSRMPETELERHRQRLERMAATGAAPRGRARDRAAARRERVRRSRQADEETAVDELEEEPTEPEEAEEIEAEIPATEETGVTEAAEAPAEAADETDEVAEGRAGEAEGRVAQDDTAGEAEGRVAQDDIGDDEESAEADSEEE
jgi:large subunit ribosomal protein L22